MNRETRIGGLLLNLMLFGMLGSTALGQVPQSIKSNSLRGSVGGDLTKATAFIFWDHYGKSQNSEMSLNNNANPTFFTFGDGGSSRQDDRLADQRQLSAWNVKAVFANGRTTFTETNPQPDTAHIDAGASVFEPGSSRSRTSLRAGGLTADAAVAKIDAKVARDDAAVNTDASTTGSASGSMAFARNGNTVLNVATILGAKKGGSASIIDNDGLRLFADPGETASFSVEATNALDPSQSFSWSAIFNGTGRPMTRATGIADPGSYFTSVGANGWFLPYDLMPSRDLTAELGAGNIEVTGAAEASVASPAAVPELSTVVSFGPAALLLIGGVLRKQKRSTSA